MRKTPFRFGAVVLGSVALVIVLTWNAFAPSSSETHMDDNGKSAELIAPNVLAGKAISTPEPEYPWLAQLFERSGEVAVDVVIDESGKVISAKAMSGPMCLKRASVECCLQSVKPTLLSGQPTKVKGLITYKFRLE